MATRIAGLQIDLSARTARFSEGLQRAQKRMEDFQKRAVSLNETFQRMTAVAQKAAVVYGALSGAITLATRRAAQYAAQVKDVSEQTGFAIETMQQLRFAVEQSAGDFQSLISALRAFNRRTAEAARGNQSFLSGFERLGFTQEQVRAGLQDMESFLLQVADRVAELGTTAEQSAVLMTVMGDAGRRLVPFMAQGAEGIRELMERARELGLVMDETQIRRLAAFNDRVDILGRRFAATGREIGYMFLPAVEAVIGLIEDATSVLQNMDPTLRSHVVRWTVVVGAVLGAIGVFGTLGRALSAAASGLATFGQIVLFAFSPLFLKLALAGAAIYTFWQAWERDWGGIRSAAEAAWEKIEPVIQAVGAGLKSTWEWVLDVAPDLWDWVKDTVQSIGEVVETAWEWTVDVAGEFFDWLKDTAWPKMVDIVSTTWVWWIDFIRNGFIQWLRDTAWPWINAVAETTWDWVIGKVDDFLTWVRDVAAPWIEGAVSTAWTWTVGIVDDFLTWIKDVAAPWINGQVRTVWEWFLKVPEWWETFINWLRGGEPQASMPAGGAPQMRAQVDAATLELMARLVQAEAGIEDFEGKVAVAAVVLNRLAAQEFPDSIREIIYQTNQFESVLNGTIDTVRATEEAFKAVHAALQGFDPTGGATFFWNPDIATSGWFKQAVASGKLVLTTRIGRHEFFRPAGYEDGTPWTGWGPLDEVAGVVHRREAVIPWDVLRRGPAAVLEFLGAPGFQEGRVPTAALIGVTDEMWAQHPGFAPGAIARMIESVIAGLETRGIIDPDTARGLRDLFGNLLDIVGSLYDRAIELWDLLGQVEDRFDEALAQVSRFQEELDELGDVTLQMVLAARARIERLDDLVEIERLIARTTGQAFDEVRFRAEELSRAIIQTARAMFEAGESAEAVAEVIAPWVEQLEPLQRQIQLQDAVNSALERLAYRLGEVNDGLAFFVRALRWEPGRGFSFDLGSLLQNAIAFLADVIFDAATASNEEIRRRIAEVPDPGKDILSIAESFSRYENLESNIRERQQELRRLQELQRKIQQRTTAGTVGGAALGAAIGTFILPGAGTLVGGLLGGLFGGSSAKKKAEQDYGPQIRAAEEKIRELEAQIEGAVTDLINALGIAADNFASGIAAAFREADISGFSERLRESVRDTIRQAMIQAFVAQILEPQIMALAEMVQDAFLSGAPLDMAAIDAQIESIVDVSAQLYDRFEQLGLTVERTNEAMSRFVRNIPSGYRVERALFEVSPPRVPAMANGGIVTRPTVALIGEAGPEAVVPLSSGFGTINIRIERMEVQDGTDFGRRLDQELRRRGLVMAGNPTGWRGRR